jgi:hypothetical protein
MDYTSDPSSNQQPNYHDFEELATIYSHLDSFTTLSQTTPFPVAQGNFDNPSDWGKLARRNGNVAVYERDFGFGQRLLTSVILVD